MLPPKGQYPSGENAGQEWYLKMQKDLLNLKVTRSASLKLQASTMDTLEQAMVTRKRKNPQNKSITSPGKKMQPSLDSESSGLMPSSSGSPPSPEHMLLGEEYGNQPFNPSVIWFCSPEAHVLF